MMRVVHTGPRAQRSYREKRTLRSKQSVLPMDEILLYVFVSSALKLLQRMLSRGTGSPPIRERNLRSINLKGTENGNCIYWFGFHQ
jgi:hypothetical protein